MKQITFNGETYNLAMNWKTAIEYERETNRNALDLEQWAENTIEPKLVLGLAMMKANNKDVKIKSVDELINIMDEDRLAAAKFIQIVVEELMEFMQLKDGDADKEEQKKKGKKQKNE